MKRYPSLLEACLACAIVSWNGFSQAADISDGRSAISLEKIKAELKAVPPDIRQAMSREQMSKFVSNILIDARIEKAAQDAKTAEQLDVQSAIARSTRDIVVRAYIESESKKLGDALPNLEPLARERYQANRSTYVEPAGIRVAHILLKINPEESDSTEQVVQAKGEEILAEIKKGADFSELARKYSQDHGSMTRGGELPGWRDKGTLVPSFEEVAYSLEPGGVSNLVRSRFGLHIIKLIEKRESRQKTFEEVKTQMIRTLRDELLGARRAEWLKQFDSLKPVVMDDAVLEKLKAP